MAASMVSTAGPSRAPACVLGSDSGHLLLLRLSRRAARVRSPRPCSSAPPPGASPPRRRPCSPPASLRFQPCNPPASMAPAPARATTVRPSSPGGDNPDEEADLPLLQELADCLVLPPKFLSQLPRDLRLDLNDAAFDLSNGPVLDECGQEMGDLLLNLARAWEMADTSTSNSLAKQLPSMEPYLTGSAKSACGKRLVSAGRRFQSMGQYGKGELKTIAETMIKIGKLLSKRPVIQSEIQAMKEKRKLKFGELEFELTAEKANIGAAVGLVFGFLSWQLAQGVQRIPDSSMQYANENALQLAKSLKVALLVLGYTSTVLSVFTSLALLLLAQQINSENKSE